MPASAADMHRQTCTISTPWSIAAAGPVLDLSFLIDHVMMDIKPLHWGDVISSDVPLKVMHHTALPIAVSRHMLQAAMPHRDTGQV